MLMTTKRLANILEPEDEANLYANLVREPVARQAFQLVLHSGLRRKELEGLRWSDIDQWQQLISPKCGSDREDSVIMDGVASAVLEDLKRVTRASGFVLGKNPKRALKQALNTLNAAANRMGFGLCYDDLLATFAYRAAKSGLVGWAWASCTNWRVRVPSK
jgi:integrase